MEERESVDTRRKKGKSSMISGYLPRSVYEAQKATNSDTYSLSNVRITGESVVIIDGDNVVREIPFDHIGKLVVENEKRLACYYSNKKVGYMLCIEGEGVEKWKSHVDGVMQRYQKFIKLANENPKQYGVEISKRELQLLKKQKQQAQESDAEKARYCI